MRNSFDQGVLFGYSDVQVCGGNPLNDADCVPVPSQAEANLITDPIEAERWILAVRFIARVLSLFQLWMITDILLMTNPHTVLQPIEKPYCDIRCTEPMDANGTGIHRFSCANI
jgi:hypothetical protein